MRLCRLIMIAIGLAAGVAAPPALAVTHSVASPQNPTDLVYYDLPRLEVSIGPEGSTLIRVNLAVHVARQDIPALEAQMPRLIDKLNAFFARLSPGDVEGSQNLSFLRQDVVTQLNGVAKPVIIRDVSFQRLLVM